MFTHSHQIECSATNKNESCSLRQLDDSVYDEATSTQPNYTLGSDIEAVSNPATNGYDSIECMTKPTMELANHTPKNESHICDNEQKPCDVANARKEKKSDAGKCPNEVNKANNKKKDKKESDKRNKPKSSVQETPATLTPGRDDASNKEDDFNDAEEHTYSCNQK